MCDPRRSTMWMHNARFVLLVAGCILGWCHGGVHAAPAYCELGSTLSTLFPLLIPHFSAFVRSPSVPFSAQGRPQACCSWSTRRARVELSAWGPRPAWASAGARRRRLMCLRMRDVPSEAATGEVAIMQGEFVLRRGGLSDLQALTDLSVQACVRALAARQ